MKSPRRRGPARVPPSATGPTPPAWLLREPGNAGPDGTVDEYGSAHRTDLHVRARGLHTNRHLATGLSQRHRPGAGSPASAVRSPHETQEHTPREHTLTPTQASQVPDRRCLRVEAFGPRRQATASLKAPRRARDHWVLGEKGKAPGSGGQRPQPPIRSLSRADRIAQGHSGWRTGRHARGCQRRPAAPPHPRRG